MSLKLHHKKPLLKQGYGIITEMYILQVLFWVLSFQTSLKI